MFFIVIVAAVLIIGIVALVASQFTKDNNSETETVRYYPISQPSQPTRICGSCNRNTAGSHWELDAGMLCDCVGTSRRHAHGSPTATATATTGNTTAPGAGRTAAGTTRDTATGEEELPMCATCGRVRVARRGHRDCTDCFRANRRNDDRTTMDRAVDRHRGGRDDRPAGTAPRTGAGIPPPIED